MIVLTQSYAQAGIFPLIPVGVVRAVAYCVNPEDTEQAIANLKRLHPEVDYVLNAEFVYTLNGHPSNRKVHWCYITGDAYRVAR